MKPAFTDDRLKIINCMTDVAHEELKREIREGLTAHRKYLPCKYFYDGCGSALFERICRLPEYYQTRVELSILRTVAQTIMKDLNMGSLIELGSGSNHKIKILLDAANGSRSRIRYVPVDVCEPALKQAALDLLDCYPDLTVAGIVADFHRNMDRIMVEGDKLITFFGSTIGNFTRKESSAFLRNIANAMEPRDRLIMGMDMVKKKEILETAYNDAQGVTALFNKNILLNMNRELNASFDLQAFDHLAFYNEDRECMEMHLRANVNVSVPISALDLTVVIKKGETILTEICRKFRRSAVEEMAADAGLRITRWFADRKEWFALVELMKSQGARHVLPLLEQAD